MVPINLRAQPVFLSLDEQMLARRDVLRTLHVAKSRLKAPDFKNTPPLVEPTGPRPSKNHRRVCVFHALKNEVRLHWVELLPDRLVLNIPELSEFCSDMDSQATATLKTGNSTRFTYGNGVKAPHDAVTKRIADWGIAGCSYHPDRSIPQTMSSS
jgi:hypothetical protein